MAVHWKNGEIWRNEMRQIGLGCAPFSVSRLGLGCMGMSEFYGPTDDEVSKQVLGHALDLGVNFFDTSDMYGHGHNEELLGAFLKRDGSEVRIASKFGIIRQPGSGYSRGLNNSPAYIRQACEVSLRRLRRESIDLYYIHRLDPAVAIEDSIGELSRLVEEGKIKAIGLCEVSARTLERAHAVHPIAALQSEYSLWTRDAERSVLPMCRRLGTAFVAYSPLGRGMLTGQITSPDQFAGKDFRPSLPRFQSENFDGNFELVRMLKSVANQIGATPAQVSLAWLLAQGDDVIPIPGTRRMDRLQENVDAGCIRLSGRDLEDIVAALPVGAALGERYAAEGMKGVEM